MLSANVPKSAGHALIVGGDACRPEARQVLQGIGYETAEREDPYAALLELCARPLVYRALVLSLQSLYREELAVITTVRQRFPHVSVWLAHTDGRQAALVEAMRLGAEALVSGNGVHALGDESDEPQPARPMTFRPVPADNTPAEAADPTDPADTDKSDLPDPAVHGVSGGVDGPRPAARPGNGSPFSAGHGMGNGSVNNAAGEPILSADELRALLGDPH